MGKKLPRFEDGQVLSASKLNQIAEAVEDISTSSEKYVDAVGCPSCGSDKIACKAGDEVWTWKCQNCGAIGDLQLQPVVKGQDAKEPVKTFGQADCSKAVWGEVAEHWKAEAKKAFSERDELKRKLREAKPALAEDEWRSQFQKDVPWGPLCYSGEPLHLVPDCLLRVVEGIENKDKAVARIDAPAEFVRILRSAGRDVFVPVGAWIGSAQVGILQLGVNVPVHLNNTFDKGDIRLFLQNYEYKEFQFPIAPLAERTAAAQPAGEKIVERAMPGNGTPCVTLTEIEQIMYDILRGLINEGLTLTVQCQFPLGKYRADFAMPQIKLAIECDGEMWNSQPARQKANALRDAELSKFGWTIVRFSEAELKKQQQAVKTTVMGLIHVNWKESLKDLEENMPFGEWPKSFSPVGMVVPAAMKMN
jgi:very-short-patch-repair endonuclease/predicted RNA-binding Zn-ribbon protein involved in translation (DUF1610 family)